MKNLTMYFFLFLAAWSMSCEEKAGPPTDEAIPIQIDISGRVDARFNFCLPVFRFGKIEWTEKDDANTQYMIMIPPMAKDDSGNLSAPQGILYTRTGNNAWQVAADNIEGPDQARFFGQSDRLSMTLQVSPSFGKRKCGSGGDGGSNCCTATCTDGRTLKCCGGCCGDPICGASCCP